MKQCNEYSNEFYANFYLFNSNIERRIDSTTTFFNINKLFFEKKRNQNDFCNDVINNDNEVH